MGLAATGALVGGIVVGARGTGVRAAVGAGLALGDVAAMVSVAPPGTCVGAGLPVIVSRMLLRADGRYAIIDGCHRVEACRIADGDDAVLPARVFIDLSLAQEAALWDAFNRYRRRPRQVDTFRARLIAMEPTAMAISKCIERSGLKLDLGGRQHGASIVAVTALESAYRRLGDHGLVVVLDILREAFGDDERGYQAPAIDGLSMIVSRYGDVISRNRLIDALQRLGATRLLTLAHEYRAVHLGMPVAGAWARVVVLQYNRGLRSNALPEW